MPWIPSDLRVLTYTSISPLNRRSPPLPLLSLASLVLAKSREYTKRRDRVPAKPPEAMLVANLTAGEASLGVANMALMVSLKAKFRAWVGKYLSTLARFPLQKGAIPSVAITLLVQSRTPVYGLSRRPCLIISSWFWTSSLTLSMGAATVLETPAATPESMKDSMNPSFWSAISSSEGWSLL